MKQLDTQLRRRLQIGLIGPDAGELPGDLKLTEQVLKTAERAGELIAESGAILFTGGCGGVMESSSRGAARSGGTVVGTPGNKRAISNPFVAIELLTNVDIGSFICAGIPSCDAIIVLPGGAGTMAELCIAYRMKKPCIIIKGFSEDYDKLIGKYIDNGRAVMLLGADGPENAVQMALEEAIKASG